LQRNSEEAPSLKTAECPCCSTCACASCMCAMHHVRVHVHHACVPCTMPRPYVHVHVRRAPCIMCMCVMHECHAPCVMCMCVGMIIMLELPARLRHACVSCTMRHVYVRGHDHHA
jgi:hypothetical protein